MAVALTLAPASGALAQQQYHLPLFMSASDSTRQGFVRVINRSDRAGTVTIHAIDDYGNEAEPVTLSLAAKQTRHFNSGNLEQGAPDKGLTGRVGSGQGNWRLKLETDLDIEPLAYIRTPADGFLTSIHDVVQGRSMWWNVPIFNPGRNTNQQSLLRLINTSGIDTEVTIAGLDDQGMSGQDDLNISLPADEARLYSARDLEDGHSDFEGSLGAGSGKWQLLVSADRPIQVMSLMRTPTGHMTGLSSTTGDPTIRGGPGGDELRGGNGDDVIDPGDNGRNPGELDIVHGSAGDDRIVYTGSGPSAYQELRYSDPERGDYLSTGGITATIDGAANHATVEKGSSGTDTIVDIVNPLNAAWHPPHGGFGLYGTSSDDVFNLTLEDEQWMQVVGGAGNDTFNVLGSRIVRIDYRDSANGINVDLRAGKVSNDGFGDADTINGAVWEVFGSDFSDVIRGSDRSESFAGFQGDDRIDGGGGDDRLRFDREGVAADLELDVAEGTATGTWNSGAFSYSISSIERIYGSASDDIFRGGAGDPDREDLGGADDFRVHGSAGNDRYVFTDRSGPDRLQYQEITYVELAGGVKVTIDGDANRATVDKGSAGTDTIVDINDPLGGNGGFGIHGTNSDDVFDLTFDDSHWIQIAGLEGDDTYRIRSGSVRIDYPHWLARNGISVDLRSGRVDDDGFGDADTIHGNVWEVCGTDFSDVIRGSDNDESFIGRGGDDLIDGRGGNDQLRFYGCSTRFRNLKVDLGAGTARGTLDGAEFSYTIRNIERVRGGEGDDQLYGNNSDNRLQGRGGDDILAGRGGANRFEGGDGRDTFVISYSRHGNYQRIDDFTDGEDRIDLNAWGIPSHSDLMAVVDQHVDGTGIWIDLTRFAVGGTGYYGVHLYGYFDIASLDASDFLL